MKTEEVERQRRLEKNMDVAAIHCSPDGEL